MSRPATDRAVLAWARGYTRGLPPTTRDQRRAEITSDLWEHRTEAAGSRGLWLEIAARSIAGIPADLSWRRAAVSNPARGTTMTAITARRGPTWLSGLADVLTFVLGGIALLFGALSLLGGALDNTNDTGYVAWGGMLFVTGLILLTGGWLRTRRPLPGLALVVVGAVAWSVLSYWMFFTVIAGGVLVVSAILTTNFRTPDATT
jgi:hypothetical protein